MKNTDCYFYFEHYDMGSHISCCTFKEYPLGKCPCDDCTNYVPQSKVSQIVREYLDHKAIPSAEPKTDSVDDILTLLNVKRDIGEISYDAYSELFDAISMISVEPRQVLYTGDGYANGEMVYDMANCPKCGRDFEDGDETWNCNFCPDCGQALKWEEE